MNQYPLKALNSTDNIFTIADLYGLLDYTVVTDVMDAYDLPVNYALLHTLDALYIYIDAPRCEILETYLALTLNARQAYKSELI